MIRQPPRSTHPDTPSPYTTLLRSQIYTLGSDALKDLDAALGAIAAIGYRTVELMPMADHAPIEVRDALRRAGLVAHGTQTSFVTPSGPNLTTGLAEQNEAARTIGLEWLVPSLFDLPRRQIGRASWRERGWQDE